MSISIILIPVPGHPAVLAGSHHNSPPLPHFYNYNVPTPPSPRFYYNR